MSSNKALADVIREWSEVFMHRSMRDFRRFMEETGLTFSQISILMPLYHSKGSGVSKVGERMGVTNAAASQAVDRLVGMGLIERKEDPLDRRSKILSLTQEGRSLIEEGIRARGKWIENIAYTLSLEQQEQIISALMLLTRSASQLNEH